MSGQGGSTSWNSYQQFKAIEAELPRRERQVLEVIRRHPNGTTMKDVAEEMGKGFHVVSGRRKRLVQFGFVKLTGRIHRDCEVIEPVQPPPPDVKSPVQELLFGVSSWA